MVPGVAYNSPNKRHAVFTPKAAHPVGRCPMSFVPALLIDAGFDLVTSLDASTDDSLSFISFIHTSPYLLRLSQLLSTKPFELSTIA